MYTLHIGNKNYSSWSLRPWALLNGLHIPFTEVMHKFGDGFSSGISDISPTGRVPCLIADGTAVWDSLAIVEFLAERHPEVWPTDATARIWSRCACAEMHSGFSSLRSQHGMNIGVRVDVSRRSPELLADITRIEALWAEGLQRFGGPYLAGPRFSAVDAFFAPVAYRFQTYGVPLSARTQNYMATLLKHPAMQAWEQAALAEDFRDHPHDAELAHCGIVTADLRAPEQ